MPISIDLVPSTVHQAAQLLAKSLADKEREYFRNSLSGSYKMPNEHIRCVANRVQAVVCGGCQINRRSAGDCGKSIGLHY